jgi:hypothetical protein
MASASVAIGMAIHLGTQGMSLASKAANYALQNAIQFGSGFVQNVASGCGVKGSLLEAAEGQAESVAMDAGVKFWHSMHQGQGRTATPPALPPLPGKAMSGFLKTTRVENAVIISADDFMLELATDWGPYASRVGLYRGGPRLSRPPVPLRKLQ